MVGLGDDQFSFPPVSNPVHLMQPSSWWRISSRVYHHHDEAETSEKERDSGESSRRREEREVAEEKIDLLWEDFFRKELRVDEGRIGNEKAAVNRVRVPSGGHGGGAAVLVVAAKVIKKMFLRA